MKSRTAAAFTLVEILVVITIVGIIFAIVVGAVLPQIRRAGVVANIATVRSVARAVEQYYASPKTFAILPLTEPASAVALDTTSPADPSLATLDQVFLTTRIFDAPLHWRHRRPVQSFAGIPINYTPETRTFRENASNYDASSRSAWDSKPAPRIESRVSTPGIAPSAAAGGNFRLNGSDLSSNVVVVYAILPEITAREALAYAEELLPPDKIPALNAACEEGPLAYAAPDAATGVTTVYLYVSHR